MFFHYLHLLVFLFLYWLLSTTVRSLVRKIADKEEFERRANKKGLTCFQSISARKDTDTHTNQLFRPLFFFLSRLLLSRSWARLLFADFSFLFSFDFSLSLSFSFFILFSPTTGSIRSDHVTFPPQPSRSGSGSRRRSSRNRKLMSRPYFEVVVVVSD